MADPGIRLKKVLVIGANGFLGKRLLSQFSENKIVVESNKEERLKWEIYCADLQTDYIPSDCHPTVIDITSSENVARVVGKVMPDIVILTAAMTNVDACEDFPDKAYAINASGPKNVAQALLSTGKGKLIHVSTDFIFDGKLGGYIEDDTPNPISVYGQSKLDGERNIIESGVPYAICRTSVLYGWPGKGDHENFFSWAYKSLSAGKSLTIIRGQTTTPTYVEDLAEFLFHLSQSDNTGILHTTGPDVVSRYEFVKAIVDYFGFDNALLSEVDEFRQKAARPDNSSLNTHKIQKLKFYSFHTLQENFSEIQKSLDGGLL
jgi:dTDP-4-dehydrorhamnose reductase